MAHDSVRAVPREDALLHHRLVVGVDEGRSDGSWGLLLTDNVPMYAVAGLAQLMIANRREPTRTWPVVGDLALHRDRVTGQHQVVPSRACEDETHGIS